MRSIEGERNEHSDYYLQQCQISYRSGAGERTYIVSGNRTGQQASCRAEGLRAKLFETMETLPESVDLVLLSMGICGGSAAKEPFPVKTVMPKVDDCITLLLHTDDRWFPNLKKGGHLYLTDKIQGDLSVRNIRENLIEQYGEKKGLRIFDIWFDSYKSVDVIDTGVYDSYDREYLRIAEEEAAMINCPVCHVPGSNHLLEKLVGGRWDHQFLVVKKGRVLYDEDFLI